MLNDNCHLSAIIWCIQMEELGKLIADIKVILYGTSETEPIPEACAQVTQEVFRENTLRLLIICLPKLDLEVSNITYRVYLENRNPPHLIIFNFCN